MNEYTIGYIAFGSIVGLALMTLFYMLGGRDNKWLRRFIAPLIQTINSNVCFYMMGLWNIWLLAMYPLICGGLSLGYGADKLGTKVIRRLIYCIGNLAVGGLFIWLYGSKMLWVFIPNVGVALWSIYMGIRNPIYAAAEEVFICVLLYLMTNAYPFVPLLIK